ncbi:MAG TPA: hypothetical protein VJA46_04635 [Acidimicrobiia bacterium]|nr:hypothetical protein [Acidimicrobiia bacterium]
MKPLVVTALLLVVACAGTAGSTTTTTAVVTTTTTGGTTTTATPVDCPAAPYELGFLPTGVGTGLLDPDEIELDVWTSVGGSQTKFFGREDATVAIALIRGTLPSVAWPAEKGEVLIDGTRGVVGPHPDGSWVAGWYEEPGERCDRYTMVFYPPVAPLDVEAVLAGMNRVGG